MKYSLVAIVGIRRRAIALWGVLGTFLLGGALLAERASCIEIVTGPEAEATRFAERLSGRMMTFFDWGEYAIWHLAPAIQVSMDGRRETVYSDLVTASHLRIYTNAADSVGLVERFQPDWIWFPRHWPVVARLQEAGWHTAFRGPVSVILGRRPVAITEVAATESGQRCFPQY